MTETNGQNGGDGTGANGGEGAGGANGSGQQAAARPDYIPEKFWDAEKAAPRVEDLAKSYTTLEAGRGKLKETLTAEINAERFKGRPEKPEGYKIGPADGVADVVILDKVPDNLQPEAGKTYAVLKSDSKLAAGIRAVAHEYGVPQAKVSELVTEMAREIGFRPPTPEEAAAAQTEFYKSLGERGEERVRHLNEGLKAAIGDKAAALDLVGKASAAQIEAIEALLEKSGQAKFSPGVTGTEPALTEAELKAIQASPEYLAETSTEGPLHKKVRAGWLKLHPPGSEPADRVLNRSAHR